MLRHCRGVAQCYTLHLAGVTQRHEVEYVSPQPVPGRTNLCISHAVTAGVVIDVCLHRFPARGPYRSVVIDIKVLAAVVHRHVVVPVACDATETGIAVEAVPPGGVRDYGEEVLVTQVIDPGPWSFVLGDDILSGGIIKISVFHSQISRGVLFIIQSRRYRSALTVILCLSVFKFIPPAEFQDDCGNYHHGHGNVELGPFPHHEEHREGHE